ncbi:AbrB/MazE/SpoVT family DNA-binding domain-containing protein [Oceanobacillus salinisoli]|uniref:AbrB/MazE/SpoVT family DNA-binding domain-containing protein n=1 Tax=Oceanobacillus salinisoli TaxID=2678611 RepID=UPI0012E254A9|nr:AbrB/MazE/SpoVT family DNA-binding domain-containing protein [Oceanobacillus salinisoli]
MKSTGIIRKVDELGRVVLPVELRNTLDINPKDKMEIFVESDRIVLKKHIPNLTCQVTGEASEDNIILADGKIVLSPASAKMLAKEIASQFTDDK